MHHHLAISAAALLTLLLSACASHKPGHANVPPSTLLERTVTVNDQPHKFAIWVPADYTPTGPWPCVVFLHGSGECGTDGLKQTTVGLLPAAKADPAQWPCIIIMPQKPVEAAEWEDYDAMVMAELEAAQQELNIDKQRISLTGLSQGGHGTWTIGAHHPSLFSALAPCCGYIQTHHTATVPPPDLAAFRGKPIWAFHGEKDDVVPPAETKDMISALKKARQTPEPKLTLYPDANHNCWDLAYRKENLGKWLTSKK